MLERHSMLKRLFPALDITPVWQRYHSHLRPLDEHLPIRGTECCGLCGAQGAIEIGCHLRFGPDVWIERARVRYCERCRRFSVPAEARREYVASALREAMKKRHWVSLPEYLRVTATDGRLWSRTPTVLNIEPTTRCNFSCWYCVGRHMEQVDLPFESLRQTLDNFPSLELLALVGEGEPLLHKRFFDMVRVARARGITVATISNGSVLSPNIIAAICESGLDYISFSIDSRRPETFAESRIDGDLETVLEGIERLSRYRDANGYTRPYLGLKGTLFEHTKGELRDIVAAAKRAGIEVVEGFQPLNAKESYVQLYPPGKRPLLDEVDGVSRAICATDASDILPSLPKFIAEHGLEIPLNQGKANGVRPNCDEVWLYALVSGDVTPCCQIKTPVRDEWNIVKRPVHAILGDQHYENVRFNLWNGLFLDSCRGCHKTKPGSSIV